MAISDHPKNGDCHVGHVGHVGHYENQKPLKVKNPEPFVYSFLRRVARRNSTLRNSSSDQVFTHASRVLHLAL